MIFKFARFAILVFAPYLLMNGEITPEKCLLLIVANFMIYTTVELAGSTAMAWGEQPAVSPIAAAIRVIESAIASVRPMRFMRGSFLFGAVPPRVDI